MPTTISSTCRRQPAHARLQSLIKDWMKKEIPECQALFEQHPEGDRTLEADAVSYSAATVAYEVVLLATQTIRGA